MSKIEVDAITEQSGTTLTVGGGASKTVVADATTVTLGRCGGTVALASGASQTGFGRTGTVNWNTTKKTGDFTATNGDGFFVDTGSGAVTVTLPASPSAGDIVAVSDYAATSVTNNITIARNGSNIEGSATDLIIENNGIAMTFVYVDGTRGWKTVNAGKKADSSSIVYMSATGGTETTCGDHKIHTFTGPGTFCVSVAGDIATVDYMVVAGGAAGGCNHGGGGGAGGWRASNGTSSGSYCAGPGPLTSPVSALPVTAQGYPITVGGGGASSRNPGSNSSFSSITSAGGGGGANDCHSASSGGSGGGAHRDRSSGAAGNTPPVSPPQGSGGGSTSGSGSIAGAGAGGAGGTGTPVSGAAGGAGGTGSTSSINGTPTGRAGGGGGGAYSGSGGSASGGGGAGGPSCQAGTAGTTNTGGGGGGGSTGSAAGGAGGSGIVIIRYKTQ